LAPLRDADDRALKLGREMGHDHHLDNAVSLPRAGIAAQIYAARLVGNVLATASARDS
jgi:hypothetical protein